MGHDTVDLRQALGLVEPFTVLHELWCAVLGLPFISEELP